MQTGEDAPQAEPSAHAEQGPAQAAPGIEDALHQLGAESRAGLKAASDAAKALRILVAADISLARSAFGRALALTGVAIAFGASSWLLLMAAMIAAMQSAGLSWLVSLLIAALLSIAITVGAGIGAMRYFEHTRLKATRRQFARLGFGELADLMPDTDSPVSSAEAAQRLAEAEAEAGTPIKKGLGVNVTPP
ncbi:phage holin family protein [Thermomonas sp. HDW16]|uniref:phage holin family protein n=1 Tax=Thermomonas sp. HDW16 TaxID=2714945 RepID=UPI0019815985|nr:phage holin family protein [Thermomonas sp. HDW16]